MEVEEKTIGPVEIEGNPLLWTISKTGVPRMLVTGFLSFARYCGDQLPKRTTMGCLRILAALLVIVVPRSITYLLLYPIFRLVFGNLYPAYASYKAVRTKNVKEYVKWMMYWIVFALFTCAETFTDVFFSFWFPFYYEIKTILVVWLLSPATKGSSILYRRFVHPALIRREAEIDEALARATEQGYTAVLHLGSKGVNYATTVLMQTAIKGGGGLVQQLKKSYSLSDLTGEKEDENRNTPHAHDETDMQVEPRRREQPGRRGYSPRRTQSSSTRVDMYFSEVDVDVRQARSSEPTASLTNIRSSDDISSGYSSGEALQSSRTSHGDSSFVRTASVGARTRVKPRSTTKKTPEDLGEDSDTIESPCPENISIPSSLNLVTPQQALQILLLLSRNSNIADFIEFERNSFPLNDNVDSLKNSTSQLGPEATITDLQESDSNHTPNSDLITDVQVIHSVEVKPLATLSSLEIERTKDNESVEKFQTEETGTKETDDKAASSTDSSSSDTLISEPIRTVTDEICQNKFDELRQLLNDAHRAMSGIVHTQDQLKHSNDETVSKKDSPGDSTRECYKGSNVSEENENENESTSFVDVWATPSGSRRNSDSLCRAGRYNKKPAPKAPPAKSVEDLVNDQAPAALKATLVIKTGTVRTFANTETTKDVFISHASDATVKKGKKFNKQKTKESFSKLLTIPKNILQSAFHRDGKNSSTDAASSGSRSNSVEPQDLIGVDFEKKSQLDFGGQINVLKDGDVVDKNDDNDTSNSSSDDHVAASSDNVEHLDKVEKIAKGKDELVLGNAELPMRRLESDIF